MQRSFLLTMQQKQWRRIWCDGCNKCDNCDGRDGCMV